MSLLNLMTTNLKLFAKNFFLVGNISYEVGEEQLKQVFSQVHRLFIVASLHTASVKYCC